MATTNSIGDFTFAALHAQRPGGVPLDLQGMVEIIQRPGVDDSVFVYLGRKGRPFRMNSISSFWTMVEALRNVTDYRSMSRFPAFNMVWAGIDLSMAFGTAYQVLNCEASIQKMGTVVGGVPAAFGQYVVMAEWDMIPVIAAF